MNAIETNARYGTIVIVEDNSPKGHYNHNLTVEDAIRDAGRSGSFGATLYCYDSEQHVNTPSTAVRTVKLDDRLNVISDTAV